jgi:hypothetical protein
MEKLFMTSELEKSPCWLTILWSVLSNNIFPIWKKKSKDILDLEIFFLLFLLWELFILLEEPTSIIKSIKLILIKKSMSIYSLDKLHLKKTEKIYYENNKSTLFL